MTIEKLLNCSADELQKMTNEQLLTYFEPYLKVTRPDLAMKDAKERGIKTPRLYKQDSIDAKMQKAMDIAKKFGINMNDL